MLFAQDMYRRMQWRRVTSHTRKIPTACHTKSLTPIPQERLTSHPHAQQNAFRPRGARLQSRSFACWNQWLRHSPNSTGYTSTFQEGYLVDLGLKSRSQKLGGGVGRLRRVRRVFFCCVVGVLVLTTYIVGEAAGVGVVVSNAAGVGVVIGNVAGVGGITAGVCAASVAAAGTGWGVGLFAIANTIATTAEKIPTIPIPIAQRARRWVCPCLASLCLRSISLRISASRSDAVISSVGGSVESDWISKK